MQNQKKLVHVLRHFAAITIEIGKFSTLNPAGLICKTNSLLKGEYTFFSSNDKFQPKCFGGDERQLKHC